MANPSNSTPTPGAITKSDVLAAIGETDPSGTNANALRQLIGRGSLATIQRHLADIRAERLPVLPAPSGAVPPAPAEALTAVWSAAWTWAQTQTLGRLETVTAARDAGAAQAATLTQDLNALAVQIDTLNEQLEQAQAAETAAEITRAGAAAAAQTEREQHEKSLAAAHSEIEKLTAAASAAGALALRDAQLKDLAHQSAINHLLDQVSELKSALHSHAKK